MADHRPEHRRRPSLNTPMNWLQNRHSGSKPKAIRVSAPAGPRGGILGNGATVVRTPDEALVDFRAHEYDEPLRSPPLPAIPADESGESAQEEEVDERPMHPPTPASFHSSVKSKTPTLFEESLSAFVIPPASSPPPFKPVLITAIALDSVVVTLETCTTTWRTTVETLSSRESHLSSLFARSRADSTASSSSKYSTDEIGSTYRRHLYSEGVMTTSKTSRAAHIFLDRPSAPYEHILTYLRSTSETLPRAVLLTNDGLAHSRFETLLELRDEAAYLGLDQLYALCYDELKRYAQPKRVPKPAYSLHTRGPSIKSAHASIYSMNTDDQSDVRLPVPPKRASTVSDTSKHKYHSSEASSLLYDDHPIPFRG